MITTEHFSHRTPVYDHADELLCWATRDKALEVARKPNALVNWTTRGFVRSIRLAPDPSRLSSGSHPRRQLAQPHCSENYFNVKGCWTIDRVPAKWRHHYHAVLASVYA